MEACWAFVPSRRQSIELKAVELFEGGALSPIHLLAFPFPHTIRRRGDRLWRCSTTMSVGSPLPSRR